MNGVIPGIIAGILILIGAVVAVVTVNAWSSSQQGTAQTYTAQQITAAQSSSSTAP